jgi:tetratricopeptide (TPR) repeat protein
MFSGLWEVIRNPDNRDTFTWVGGGIVAVAGAIWAVVKFLAERKQADEKKGADANTFNVGPGLAMGGNAKFRGKLSFGLGEQKAQQNFDEIKSLVNQLIADRQTPAAPGAEQAVGEAVQSIEQGAAEGDSRLQQALELLKANKTTEATQLLSAFAEDKEARAEQAIARASKDRKEAAIAYRNLGAIAGLADPKQAREAYEKALGLDPDDLESLLGTGWILIDFGNLYEAQIRLDRLVPLIKTDDQAYYQFWALIGLGKIKKQRGNLAGAFKSFMDAVAIAERLANSDPDNSDWQRHLSAGYNFVGNVQMAKGEFAGALKSYRNCFTIMDRVAKSDPGNALLQRDLAISCEKVGDVQREQGNLADALKSYKDSFAIVERLAKSGHALMLSDFASSYERVGYVQVALRDPAGGLKSYGESLAIRDRLAKSDPDNAEWQHSLAGVLSHLAYAHR